MSLFDFIRFDRDFLLDGQALFRAFLRTEFSEENLEFWLACDEFRACKEPKRSAKAKKIYMDFIAIGAPKQVNTITLPSIRTRPMIDFR